MRRLEELPASTGRAVGSGVHSKVTFFTLPVPGEGARMGLPRDGRLYA